MIALENARLIPETREALELCGPPPPRVLKVINLSHSQLMPVFEKPPRSGEAL